MVDYGRQLRAILQTLCERMEVMRAHERIQSQAQILQVPQCNESGRLSDPIRICQILKHRPDALELWLCAAPRQLFLHIGRTQVHPSDYADDEGMLICKLEQEISFTRSGSGLYEDGLFDQMGIQQRRQIARLEVAQQRFKNFAVVAKPQIVTPFPKPKMLMAVNTEGRCSHGGWHSDRHAAIHQHGLAGDEA